MAARGQGAIVVGPRQPAAAHALAHVLERRAFRTWAPRSGIPKIRNVRRPSHREAIADARRRRWAQASSIRWSSSAETRRSTCRPISTSPKKLAKRPATVRLGLYDDETSAVCRWHVPQAHYLEAWGDARGWDGTAGVAQPLIEPLYDGTSAIELCALLIDGKPGNGYELVRRTWGRCCRLRISKSVAPGRARRRRSRNRATPRSHPPSFRRVRTRRREARERPQPDGASMELIFTRGSGVHDGRYANLGWLVELPDPITKLTWDNAALLNPQDAQDARRRPARGPRHDPRPTARRSPIPAFVVPGQPKGSRGRRLGLGAHDRRPHRHRDQASTSTRFASNDAPWRCRGHGRSEPRSRRLGDDAGPPHRRHARKARAGGLAPTC